ncbi:unnamed protein product [Sphagnum jensenii]|uniref:Uncharacterized protein n=1 Tax=Sphagnum jensenii TaxID=128206 RepID=A0ABP0W4M7_9BRYO
MHTESAGERETQPPAAASSPRIPTSPSSVPRRNCDLLHFSDPFWASRPPPVHFPNRNCHLLYFSDPFWAFRPPLVLFQSGTVVFYSDPFYAFRTRLVLVHAGIVIFSKSMTHSKPNR